MECAFYLDIQICALILCFHRDVRYPIKVNLEWHAEANFIGMYDAY